jgi:hypothetical protein
MVKERVSAYRQPLYYRRVFFFLVTLLACISSVKAYEPGAAKTISIDTTMPSTIPPDIVADWEAQDSAATIGYAQAIQNIISKLPEKYASKAEQGTSQEAYLKTCHIRRVSRMEPYAPQLQKVLYARHYDLGGGVIGYIEDLNSDEYTSPCTEARFNVPAVCKGTNYTKGSALMICDMSNSFYGTPAILLLDSSGVIRDPCLSYDGTKVAFAWSQDNNGYHIWEMDIATKATRQLTQDLTGLTVSDFEPCYLPNNDILFNSSRCFVQIGREFNIGSNLFLMNKDGKYLRRIGYDQGHITYPTMMSDGRILYSRYEYNDRNPNNIYGLFRMNIDGTHQTEYYGNQSSTPATLPQAREIPGTDCKVLAITGGYMGKYNGALCIVDPNLGRNGKQSVQLICPRRDWPTTSSITGVPETEKLFQNPYPLDRTWFLVSYRENTDSKFAIYLMNVEGERELLASDSTMSLSQPIPLVARPLPPIYAYQADYAKTTGEVRMTNAYYGAGTGDSVRPKTIKKIRVIQLDYRIYPWFGSTGASAHLGTPVARWMGSLESKRIVGEMPVESDGSAAFIVPARKPLFFQLIDTFGCAIQSMRSWVTLQPGEKLACYGCHEDKNTPPTPSPNPIASTPKPLEPFFDIQNDFLYYPKYIQPILDKHCVSCHDSGSESGLDLRGDRFWTGTLTNDADNKTACRYWTRSYYNLTTGVGGFSAAGKYVTISGLDVMARAEGLQPNSFGSQKSALITKLREGHSDVTLSEEKMGKLCAWIDLCIPHSGYYTDDMKPTDSAEYADRFQKLRGAHELLEEANIQEFIKDGGYGSYISAINYRIGKKSGSSALPHFKVRFSLSSRKLTVQVPCAGKLILMDIRGRRISAYNVAKNGTSILLKARLSAGLYIVKFSGAGVNEQQIVSAL